MTLFDFAFNNIKRDFSTYVYHFVSCTFSVFVFFLFSTLAMHPALQIVDAGSTIGIIVFVANIISVIFSSALILYSIGNFLKNRSKQFAVLNIIGTSKAQFNKLIFLENMILSMPALFSGIVMGIIFSKFFLMLAQRMIGDLGLYFYFPITAIILTVVLMGGMFFSIALLTPIILRKKKIIELLKKEEVAEKNYFIPATVMFFIILPLTIYVNITTDDLIPVYLFMVLSLIIVPYFISYLIFSVYQFVIKKAGKMYMGNNLIKISNFKYKINTNVKTMTGSMILLSTILISFIYIMAAPVNVAEDTKKIMPYSYMYASWEREINGDEKAKLILNELSDSNDLKQLTISYAKLESDVRTKRDIILSNKMYNSVADFLNRIGSSWKITVIFYLG